MVSQWFFKSFLWFYRLRMWPSVDTGHSITFDQAICSSPHLICVRFFLVGQIVAVNQLNNCDSPDNPTNSNVSPFPQDDVASVVNVSGVVQPL
jgi:hypothetical protein